MLAKKRVWSTLGVGLLILAACGPAPPVVEEEEEEKDRDPPPIIPDSAGPLPMNEAELAEANGVAAALGYRGDAIGYFDAGETDVETENDFGNKGLYLRDYGITDPDARVTMACMGINVSGNMLPERGTIVNLRQGTNGDGTPMVDQDGTPIIKFGFLGGWHEVCAIYLVEA